MPGSPVSRSFLSAVSVLSCAEALLPPLLLPELLCEPLLVVAISASLGWMGTSLKM
jgi:hypothetical protein